VFGLYPSEATCFIESPESLMSKRLDHPRSIARCATRNNCGLMPRVIGRSEESRYAHRLHGLLLVSAGQSCREVAQLFGEDGTTVQRWVQRFEHGGLEALREGERSGRPRSLQGNDWRRL
jgi:Winged helix-turn helix